MNSIENEIADTSYHQRKLLADWLWCVTSPDIILSDALFFQDAAARHAFAQPLIEISKKNPERIAHRLLEVFSTSKTKRLGERFEKFWQVAFEFHPDYELLLSNYPIRSEGKTLGEFDLVVKDNRANQVVAIELACKFYLQVNHHENEYWVGPGLADRLDKKLHRINSHQLRLAEREACQSVLKNIEIKIDRSNLILKGRLFQGVGANRCDGQLINDTALIHEWISRKALALFSKEHSVAEEKMSWIIIEKKDWFSEPVLSEPDLSEYSRIDILNTEQLLKVSFERPKQVIGYVDSNVVKRFFVVEDDWLSRAAKTIE